MRWRHTWAGVAVREYLEAELWVLIEDFDPARRVVTAILAYEILVPEQALESFAHLFAPGRAGVVLERCAAVGNELVEIVRHLGLRSDRLVGPIFAQISARRQSRTRYERVDKARCRPSYGCNRRSLSSERVNRECGAGRGPKSAAAPATVSGEPVPQATGSNPGRR